MSLQQQQHKQQLQQKMYDILASNKSYIYTKAVIETLIEEGADIHEPLTKKGDYAFHAIIMRILKYYNTDIKIICDYLLQHNCDINAIDNEKKTPFYSLCEGITKNYGGKRKMIQYLLESGAILNYSEKFGKKNLLYILNDNSQEGYDTYLDIFNAELDTFLIDYSYIIDYCLFSSPISFKYLLKNCILDIRHLLLKYAEHKNIGYADEDYFYNNDIFDYRETFWFMVADETNMLPFKKFRTLESLNNERNIIIEKYLEDSINFWSPPRHYIQPTCVRNAVWCILLTQYKINQIEDHPLFLPPEMWFHICSFLTREMWMIITHKTIPIEKFTRIQNLPCLL